MHVKINDLCFETSPHVNKLETKITWSHSVKEKEGSVVQEYLLVHYWSKNRHMIGTIGFVAISEKQKSLHNNGISNNFRGSVAQAMITLLEYGLLYEFSEFGLQSYENKPVLISKLFGFKEEGIERLLLWCKELHKCTYSLFKQWLYLRKLSVL